MLCVGKRKGCFIMSRMIGTVSRGVRTPIIRNGDDIVSIVTDSVLEAAVDGGFEIRDRDIVAMTEAIVRSEDVV